MNILNVKIEQRHVDKARAADEDTKCRRSECCVVSQRLRELLSVRRICTGATRIRFSEAQAPTEREDWYTSALPAEGEKIVDDYDEGKNALGEFKIEIVDELVLYLTEEGKKNFTVTE